MARILVTGAAGFLGSHIALKHLIAGDSVTGVDDLCSSLGLDAPNVRTLKEFKNFNLVIDDICDDPFAGWVPDRDDDPDGPRVDLIYNMACPASPPRYQSMPVHTTMTCVMGTKNVLELAKWHGARVVHASTSEVYGDPQHNPQVETDWGNVNSYGPRSCYDEGKRCAEGLCWSYRNRYCVDVKIARIFNTYGNWMDPDDGRVVTNFIKQFMTNSDVTIYGDGKQTRSFCYYSDTVEGLMRLAQSDEEFSGPVNIGNPDEFSMAELAEMVRQLIPESRSKVVYRPLPTDDPRQRKPNIDLAKRALGWEPQMNILTGLSRTIEYMETVKQYFDREWVCKKQ